MRRDRMAITLARLYRYPVKGLRAEALDAADLTGGGGVPHDRRFAVARGDTTLPAPSRWLPKQRFVMLMRDAELARVGCRLDVQHGTLELTAPERPSCRGAVESAAERARLDAYLNEVLGPRREGPARLVEAGPQSFTDVPQNCLSLINLASVRELEVRIGQALDPLRFRGNLYVDGAPAWSEFEWVGGAIRIGGVELHVPARIPRCAATAVNPATGGRDVNVVKAMRAAYGHYDMGVYAEVATSGRIAVGDTVEPPGRVRPRSRVAHWLRFLGFLARSAPIVFGRR
jgi:uncharacterized protein